MLSQLKFLATRRLPLEGFKFWFPSISHSNGTIDRRVQFFRLVLLTIYEIFGPFVDRMREGQSTISRKNKMEFFHYICSNCLMSTTHRAMCVDYSPCNVCRLLTVQCVATTHRAMCVDYSPCKTVNKQSFLASHGSFQYNLLRESPLPRNRADISHRCPA